MYKRLEAFSSEHFLSLDTQECVQGRVRQIYNVSHPNFALRENI